MRFCLTVGAVSLVVAAATDAAASPALPKDFVALSEVAPDIVEEMRYAGANNFTGAPLPGYTQAHCYLTRPAAEALIGVQARLKPFGLGLKVFDCYRPLRAVRRLVRWAKTRGPQGQAQAFLGRGVLKEAVFDYGYLSRRSAHCRGSTVDVTLIDLTKPNTSPSSSEPPLPCDVPRDRSKTQGNALDLGTQFDCLSPRSHTRNPEVDGASRAHRLLLWHLMRQAGFVGYPKEWWHFRFKNEPYPQTSFDIPLPAPP